MGCLVRTSYALGHMVLGVSEFVDAPFLIYKTAYKFLERKITSAYPVTVNPCISKYYFRLYFVSLINLFNQNCFCISYKRGYY